VDIQSLEAPVNLSGEPDRGAKCIDIAVMLRSVDRRTAEGPTGAPPAAAVGEVMDLESTPRERAGTSGVAADAAER
jgi:hypothetical protein